VKKKRREGGSAALPMEAAETANVTHAKATFKNIFENILVFLVWGTLFDRL
jgi:hypothetical protein